MSFQLPRHQQQQPSMEFCMMVATKLWLKHGTKQTMMPACQNHADRWSAEAQFNRPVARTHPDKAMEVPSSQGSSSLFTSGVWRGCLLLIQPILTRPAQLTAPPPLWERSINSWTDTSLGGAWEERIQKNPARTLYSNSLLCRSVTFGVWDSSQFWKFGTILQ